MTDTHEMRPPEANSAPPSDIAVPDAAACRGEDAHAILRADQSINPDFVEHVVAALNVDNAQDVIALCADLHPADMADLLRHMEGDARQTLVTLLGTALKADTLVELEDEIRDSVLDAMPMRQLADAVSGLATDDATSVLEDMDEDNRRNVLAEIPLSERIAVQAALDYAEDSAGRMMQRQVFAAPAYWTVGRIIDRLRSAHDLPRKFYEVLVVDPSFRTLGTVTLSTVLRSPRDVVIENLIGEGRLHRIPVDMDQEEVAYLFKKYSLISAPVVDKSDRLVGLITVDDVVEIVHEEIHEDMLALAGVGTDAGIFSMSVRRMVQSRFTWLAVNLLTAILASLVISLFGATIEQAVAIAILMPIVASMGGNAGTQTLTVAVRNLATKNLTHANAMRSILREAAVGFVNGIAFAVLMGVAAGVWYATIGGGNGAADGITLALVLGVAMIFTLFCAALVGILVPLGLQHTGADPAVSSAVFVTTATDIIGFFAFLGLAALFLV